MASLTGFRAITLPVEMLRVGLTPTRPDAAWTSSMAVKQSGARGGHDTHCTSSYSGTSARHDGPFLFPTQFLRGLDEVRAKCRSTGGDELRWRRQRCHVFRLVLIVFCLHTTRSGVSRFPYGNVYNIFHL
ncbi:uncharacterized protein LY79DRAFT_306103 [Colletotrichum navitas]|uniref:Uncharacterized protein n=1 Tax=Colletotrichum navitas TaxID=681940 RepID=A0AAD8PTH4_9PEZI|nr:uncharacterized protein LY79DRAFT_306103 [Colletotrichum navitas]KAK1580405.1 hypothetical protein LY79DRAFT_306103 [Colletotrichum navitas]